MLSEKQIKATIVQRVRAACKTCNSHHLTCIEGQLRGLLAALGDGSAPIVPHGSVLPVLDAAGIPYKTFDGGEFEFDEEWMKEHGFEIDEQADEYFHPTLGEGW